MALGWICGGNSVYAADADLYPDRGTDLLDRDLIGYDPGRILQKDRW